MRLINDNDPPAPKTDPIKVPELNPEVLRRIKHDEWLADFSTTMQAGREKRGGLMTPFLQGAITKLQWAAQYIRLLKSDLHWLARDNKLLRKHIEHLGAVPAPAFRPAAEEAADPAPADIYQQVQDAATLPVEKALTDLIAIEGEPTDARELMTVQEVMYELSISRATVYELLKSGALKSVSIGANRRIWRSSVDHIVQHGASTKLPGVEGTS